MYKNENKRGSFTDKQRIEKQKLLILQNGMKTKEEKMYGEKSTKFES